MSQPFVVMAKPVGPICNLDCGYCYYLSKTGLFPPGERYRMRDETLATYVRSFIEASPGPLVHFAWHGGEPTLAGIGFYRRALELQREYLPFGWECVNNLQTNGGLIDEEWCAFLAANHFQVGLSIDGPARIHDGARVDKSGRPSHARAMRALNLLRRHNIEPDVLCTLNARTAACPEEVYRFFVENRVRWLQFLPVVLRNRDGSVADISVTPAAMGEFMCRVFDQWVRHDVGRINVQAFSECLLIWSGRPTNLCTMAETCGRVLAMEHDGSVYSCDHFVDRSHLLGDIASDRMALLVEGGRQVSFGRSKSDALPGQCLDCAVLDVCNGGCPKDRFNFTDDGDPGLNYLCAGFRRFYEHIGPYMVRMAELTNDDSPITAIMAEARRRDSSVGPQWRSPSRNDPCPCGSGRKYKHCCLAANERA